MTKEAIRRAMLEVEEAAILQERSEERGAASGRRRESHAFP
jgi:hypothetical protein